MNFYHALIEVLVKISDFLLKEEVSLLLTIQDVQDRDLQ